LTCLFRKPRTDVLGYLNAVPAGLHARNTLATELN
jgi:hypothetical protein